MKVILSQKIRLKDFRKGFRTIRKEFQSNVIPHRGDLVGDPCFEDSSEYEVIETIINYHKDECHVVLKSVVLETENLNRLKEYLEMTKLHGWEYAEYS